MARLLTKEDIRAILQSRFENDGCTRLGEIPKPSSLKDIAKASKRIVHAIRNKERIAIVGDYDVDGVISSVILSHFFDDMGVDYSLIIPNRFTDGYGLNPDIVSKLDVHVIITVDNGISAVEAAQICKDQGIDLIIPIITMFQPFYQKRMPSSIQSKRIALSRIVKFVELK